MQSPHDSNRYLRPTLGDQYLEYEGCLSAARPKLHKLLKEARLFKSHSLAAAIRNSNQFLRRACAICLLMEFKLGLAPELTRSAVDGGRKDSKKTPSMTLTPQVRA